MILQQLSFSDINPEWLDLFSCLFSLKNTALPPKFTFMFRSPICWQDNEEKGVLLFFWQNHMIFVLRRNGPSLRTVAEPEQRSKEFNFTLKKKKSFIQINPTSAGCFFFSILIQMEGEYGNSWAAAQEDETQGPSHKPGSWQTEIQGPSSSTSCQPRGLRSKTPGFSNNTCNPST